MPLSTDNSQIFSGDPHGWWGQLDHLDPLWHLLPCNSEKQPTDHRTGKLLSEWPTKSIPIKEFKLLNRAKIQAVGLALGPVSGGVLAVDFDAEGYEEIFESEFGRALKDLPDTVAWTSGREGRKQMAYKIDKKYWHQKNLKRQWKNKNGRTCLEFRWKGQQSIILGAHPETSGYRWCEGASPLDLVVADAPEWLVTSPLPRQVDTPVIFTDAGDDECQRARQLLSHIDPRDDYDEWLKVGMSLKSVDDSLLDDWIDWSKGSNCFDEEECIHKWESFNGEGVTIGTLRYMANHDSGNQVKCDWYRPEFNARKFKQVDTDDDESIEESLNELIRLYSESRLDAEELLPGYLRDAMSIIRTTVEYDWSVLFLVLIVGISGALPLESSIELIEGDFEQSLNLFAVLLMETGEVKSPLIKRLVSTPWKKSVDVIMKQRYLGASKDWKRLNDDSAESNADFDAPKPQPVQTLITEDLTPQGVERHLVLHDQYAKGSVLLLIDEGKDMLAEMSGQTSSTNQLKLGSWILSRYDGTGGRGAKADAAYERHYSQCRVSALFCCQPDIYREITGDADQSGLAGRFIAVEQATVQQHFPEDFDSCHQQKHKELSELLVALYMYVCDRGQIQLVLSDEARRLFQRERHYLNQRKSQTLNDAERGQLNKAHGRLGRLAGIEHLLWSFDHTNPSARDLPLIVEADSMKRAIKANRFLLSQSVLVRQTSKGNNLAMQKIQAFHNKALKVEKVSKVSGIRKSLNSPMRATTAETELIATALNKIGVGRLSRDEKGVLWYQALKPMGT